MKLRRLSPLGAAFTLLFAAAAGAPGAFALEKTARRIPTELDDSWSGGRTYSFSYYNVCSGWIWAWYGFEDGAGFGVVHDVPESARMLQIQVLCPTGAPSGYGFTGTRAIHRADEWDCPTDFPLGSAPFLPMSPFTIVNFVGETLPLRFVLLLTLAESPEATNPYSFATDHPAAGPTGPQPCGTCYSPSRVNRSFRYGTPGYWLCPGSPFNDGVCDAQLFWNVLIDAPVPVEELSWARIKCLYQ